MKLLNELLRLRKSGLNVFPSKNKAPVGAWKKFQNILIPENELYAIAKSREWSEIGIILGYNGIECIDIDNPEKSQRPTQILEQARKSLPEIFKNLYIEKTPNNGYHIVYKTENVLPNMRLARTVDGKVLVETRGQGGFVVVAPSPGYTPVQGSLTQLPTLSDEQRTTLLSFFSQYNEFDEISLTENISLGSNGNSFRPGDIYNQKNHHLEILRKHGWTQTGENSLVQFWKRPNTEKECSATWNPHIRRFYVFSTNAHPLPYGKPLTPFAVYSFLEHNGDFQKAAKSLLKNNIVEIPKVEVLEKKNDWNIAEEFLLQKAQFRYNVVKNRVEYNSGEGWQILDDKTVSEWFSEFRKLGHRMGHETFMRVILGDISPRYNVFEEYFSHIFWDGNDYIQEFISHIDTPKKENLENYFRKWIVGVVAQMLRKGKNDHCFTLVGPQGIGKTTFFSYLVPKPLMDYYTISTSAIDPQDKDSQILVAEKFLINLDELESSSKTDLSALKSILTTTKVSVRRPYAHFAEEMPRHASFCASVNHTSFLDDPTGNRRFLIVPVNKIVFPENFDVDGLYAQAKYLLDTGFRYWFSGEEIQRLHEENEEYRLIPPEEELLRKYYEPVEIPTELFPKDIVSWAQLKGYELLTATEILENLQRNSTFRNLSRRNLGISLRKLGFQQIFVHYGESGKIGSRKYVLKPTTSLNNISQNFLKENDDDPGF